MRFRFEVRPFGVDVSLIAPGMVRTRFGEVAAGRRDAGSIDAAYDDYNARIADVTLTWDKGMRARIACEPSDVAERVLRAAASRNPRARYRVAPSAAIMLSLRRVLPERAFEAVLRTQFPSPARAGPRARGLTLSRSDADPDAAAAAGLIARPSRAGGVVAVALASGEPRVVEQPPWPRLDQRAGRSAARAWWPAPARSAPRRRPRWAARATWARGRAGGRTRGTGTARTSAAGRRTSCTGRTVVQKCERRGTSARKAVVSTIAMSIRATRTPPAHHCVPPSAE